MEIDHLNDYVRKLSELQNQTAPKGEPMPGRCPKCGYCPSCGQGGNVLMNPKISFPQEMLQQQQVLNPMPDSIYWNKNNL